MRCRARSLHTAIGTPLCPYSIAYCRSCGWFTAGLLIWAGCSKSRRYSRDTYPETYVTKYTSKWRFKNESKQLKTLLPSVGPVDDSLPGDLRNEIFFTLVTVPRWSLSLTLSDTRVFEMNRVVWGVQCTFVYEALLQIVIGPPPCTSAIACRRSCGLFTAG